MKENKQMEHLVFGQFCYGFVVVLVTDINQAPSIARHIGGTQ
jgi:hypothetical protein